MSYYDNPEDGRRRGRKILTWCIICVIVLVAAIVFLVAGVADSWNIMLRGLLNDLWYGWVVAPGASPTPFVWWVVLGLVVALLWVFEGLKGWVSVIVTFAIIGLVGVSSVASFMWGELGARHYNSDTTYVVADTDNMPNTLLHVAASPSSQIGITEGVMPTQWEQRVASATGATYVMQKTGDTNANTELLPETITYIYDDDGSGAWTAIRDGRNRQMIFGVATWKGAGHPVETCEFEGDYELRQAFGGSWGKNLRDEIAAFDLHFTYSSQDMYGYCDGDEPVVVIPGTRTGSTGARTINEAYGVMIITGSPSGRPVIEFRDTVAPGELPGPVYPIRLVQSQREALGWSAGRRWMWQDSVGFEPTDTSSQAGNNTDFLLKSSEDGRLYWVTPMKPVRTEAQTLVAYSVTPADEITAGKLNQQRVYVLDGDDQRVVNLNDLENAVTQAVARVDPGFFTGSAENVGQIVEFIPTSDSSWQVFAERGGRAVYRIDISGGARMSTSVAHITEDGTVQGRPTAPDSTAGSGGDEDSRLSCESPSSLSDADLANCLRLLTDELVARQQAATQ